jgi:hypothetical protein
MKRSSVGQLVRNAIRRMLGKAEEPPEDPYAYVGAPKKPRPPLRSAAAREPLE